MKYLDIETINNSLESKEATEMADLDRLETTETITTVNEEETVMADTVTPAIEETMEMEITPTDRKVMLCSVGNGREIYMVKEVNDSTGEVAGYYIHMEENGFPLIGVGNRIKISQKNLATSTDYKIMNCLRNFNSLFTEDMLKRAYERAKHYYEISAVAVKQHKDRSVIDVYAELVTYIEWMAKSEIEDGITEEDRKYFCKDNIAEIESKELDKVLEDIEAGCSKTVFAKNILSIEEIMDRHLIVTNKGRLGFNKTGNKRVYKFIVDEDLIKMYEAKEVS